MKIAVKEHSTRYVSVPKQKYRHWMEGKKLKQQLVIKGFSFIDLNDYPIF